MQPLLPVDDALNDAQLTDRYAYPEALNAPFVRVNFVARADGACTFEGRTAGLGSPADRRVFMLLRQLADVVLVGAGTVRAEDYGGVRSGGTPIAVVSGSAQLDPASRLFTDTHVPPIVLTLASAPHERRNLLAAAGGDIVALDRLTPDLVLAELARRGLHRVLCEGGPTFFGELVAADAVDELCLTVAPLLVGGTAGRIAIGPESGHHHPLKLLEILHEDDVLLLRYGRDHDAR
ncbi:pyrimidine reductase family protein [Pseudonocardia kunmingensis]|uniref:5-amino-6-(5-phosphoribosylamino)uracil reductase n=1 Tax=Pseudonocardia kunmingensis TaxID=630975 RepID=A0A543DPB4_9PSEU|nr:pyrimidine reductase family protein [Pseudonocardia kunmingensis]TQM11171.1 5-amino-6-(5-phosphoribosylamino)uracil reductase [Pseudonocardia kunmingensis]